MTTLSKIAITFILGLLLASCNYDLSLNSSDLSPNNNITLTKASRNESKLIASHFNKSDFDIITNS